MRYRIYPKRHVVLSVFSARLANAKDELAKLDPNSSSVFYYQSEIAALTEEIALIQSHGPEEIAVELEDQK